MPRLPSVLGVIIRKIYRLKRGSIFDRAWLLLWDIMRSGKVGGRFYGCCHIYQFECRYWWVILFIKSWFRFICTWYIVWSITYIGLNSEKCFVFRFFHVKVCFFMLFIIFFLSLENWKSSEFIIIYWHKAYTEHTGGYWGHVSLFVSLFELISIVSQKTWSNDLKFVRYIKQI